MNWAPVDLHTVHKCLTNIDVKIGSRPMADRPPTNSGLATKPKARFSESTATYLYYNSRSLLQRVCTLCSFSAPAAPAKTPLFTAGKPLWRSKWPLWPARLLLERSEAPFGPASAPLVRSKWPLRPAPVPPVRWKRLLWPTAALPVRSK